MLSEQKIKQILHNMGYRPKTWQGDVWAKPVGYACFMFRIETMSLEVWFGEGKRGSDKVEAKLHDRMYWDAAKHGEETFDSWIPFAEWQMQDNPRLGSWIAAFRTETIQG